MPSPHGLSPVGTTEAAGPPPSVVESAIAGVDSVFRNGAPWSTKMGTIRSPWRYDALAVATLPPMLNCAVMVAAAYQCAAEALGQSPAMLSMAVRRGGRIRGTPI